MIGEGGGEGAGVADDEEKEEEGIEDIFTNSLIDVRP